MVNGWVQSVDENEIIEAFELLPSWDERYELIDDLGKQLPAMPKAEKVDANLVPGCTTRAWLTAQLCGDPPTLGYHGDAEGPLVRGLVALLLVPFQGKSAREVLDTDPSGFFDRLGLEQHLSAGRRVGMRAFLDRVKAIARAALEQ